MKAYRVPINPEAFSLSHGKKRKRDENPDHLKWIRSLPCLVTGKRPADAAHVRYGDPRYGKRETGGQEKPSDKYAVPLHRECHTEQHDQNEREFWKAKEIDPLNVALALFGVSGDDEAAELILKNARR